MEHRAITRVKAFVPGPSASSPELTALGPFALALPYNARFHGTWATLFFCANFHWEAEARRATISGRHTPGPTKTVGSFPPRLLPKGFSQGLAKANVRKIRGKSSGPGWDVLESNQATASRSRLAAPASGPTFSELPANPVPFSTPSFSHSPTQQKVASIARGRSKRVSAMTSKVITLEFVVPTVLALALGIVLSIGAVYLTDKYLVPIDQAEAHLPFHR
jgi:hypothetical protein